MRNEADKPAVETDPAKSKQQEAAVKPADGKAPEELIDDDLDKVAGGQTCGNRGSRG